MKSCIYEGAVRHRRLWPRKHEFNFRLYMLWIDLDEIEQVFRGRWLWSHRRTAFARFRPEDHMKHLPGNGSLREKVETTLQQRGVEQPVGSVGLLTQIRYLGFRMTPVSFYYCYDADDRDLIAVLAEVNNTPWGEQHIYLVRPPTGSSPRESNSQKSIHGDRIRKDFHVSPFMSMNMHYRMMFSAPGDRLGIKIENHQYQDETTSSHSAENVAPDRMPNRRSIRMFNVAMSMQKKPMTTANLNRILVSYPLISFQVFAGIYWQALRLYLKKIPFVPHPRKKSNDHANHQTNPDTIPTIP